MNVHEKRAWYVLCCMLISIGLFGVLQLTVFSRWSWYDSPALAAFAISGLSGFSNMIGGKKVVTDERDSLILMKSNLIGYAVFWAAALLLSFAVWFIYKDHSIVIKSDVPLHFMFMGMTLVYTAVSTTTIFLYRTKLDA